MIALFGSGELSPTGRRVHEYLIKDFKPPVKIALLETPAGFESNPHYWYQKLEQMLLIGLQNYKPEITRIEALSNSDEKSTNNETLLMPFLQADYIHTGAGSPTYAARHLKDSIAIKYLIKLANEGISISLASAAAIAFGKFLLPVYEIYKVGEDLHWKEGLNFFTQFGLDMTVVPHWNNGEGGVNIDTSRCFMGITRFEKLLRLLPEKTNIVGIDEQTAFIIDPIKQYGIVMGNGAVTIVNKSGTIKTFQSKDTLSLDLLK